MSANETSPGQSAAKPRLFKETSLAVLVLCLAGLGAYSGSFAGKFIFDDVTFTRSLQTHPLWKYLLLPGSLSRPLVSLTLGVNYALGGLSVAGYHVFNLAVHLLAATALFGVVRRTLRLKGLSERFGAAAGNIALAVALLWLVHPLQTESVAYIVQRAESLAGLFYLLTLYCVLRGAETRETAASFRRRRLVWQILAVLACALGTACKPILATAPLVVFAYDRIFLAGSVAGAWRLRWKLYAGLAASWLFLAVLLLISSPLATAGFGMAALTPWAYAKTQLGVILHYLRLSFWPSGLCLDYMWPAARGMGEILPGALGVGILAGATLWAWFRRPAWSFLGIWFFVILAPTSSFMPIADLAFEHRLYLSLAAVAAGVVLGVYLIGDAVLRRLLLIWQRSGRLAAFAAVAAAAIFLGRLTCQRNKEYRDPIAMWSDVLKKQPRNWRAYNNRGYAHYEAGSYGQALADCNQALALNPQMAEAFNNRGIILQKKGDLDGALADFGRVLALDPECLEARFNRGSLRLTKGDCEGAITDFSKALELDPWMVEARNGRGAAFEKKGCYGEAVADYTRALELNPRCAEARNGRGIARDKSNDYDGAIADYDRALELNPRYAEACNNRGIAREKKGAYAEAAADYARAIELNPNYAEAYLNRGNARAAKGDYDGAVSDYSRALELNPRYAEAYSNRGAARGAKGDCEGALADCDKALELNPRDAEACVNRGVAREDKGDCAGALADYTRAAELDRSNLKAWLDKGMLLLKLGRDADARACFDESLKINPNLKKELGGMVAKALEERQKLEKAREEK